VPPPPVQPPTGHFTVSPNPATFGAVPRAAVGANITITVTSDGTGPDSPSAFVTGDSRFSVDYKGGPSPCGTGSGLVLTIRTLQPGESCTLAVRFDPSTGALGATVAQLQIASEWGSHPTFPDTVSATVTA
jgi:hypothetical protein